MIFNKIVPLGARSQDGVRLSGPLETHFRVSMGIVVPFVLVDYSAERTVNPIKEVVLGPQNENDEQNIQIFLNSIGVENVTVRRSRLPYRT
jgi:hypothetical protein